MSYPSDSDKLLDEEHALIRHAKRGERQAFAVLVERYWERLYRWLYHLTRDRHAADVHPTQQPARIEHRFQRRMLRRRGGMRVGKAYWIDELQSARGSGFGRVLHSAMPVDDHEQRRFPKVRRR